MKFIAVRTELTWGEVKERFSPDPGAVGLENDYYTSCNWPDALVLVVAGFSPARQDGTRAAHLISEDPEYEHPYNPGTSIVVITIRDEEVIDPDDRSESIN